MPNLVVIGPQIKEKQRGAQCAHPLCIVPKDPSLNKVKFDQVMCNSFVLTWERNFELQFVIFSVLVFQLSVLESYLDIYLF